MAILPIAEIVARRLLGRGLPGSGPFVQHLTLWVAFLGAAIAASEGRHLALATLTFIRSERVRRAAEIFSSSVAAAVAALLARACLDLVWVERSAGGVIALGVPVWVAQIVLPLSFALIALRVARRASATWLGRALPIAGIVVGLWLGHFPQVLEGLPVWPGLTIVLLAVALGGPIFMVLGGTAVLLFLAQGTPAAAVPTAT